MSIIGGIMVPHPPLIVPQVGQGRERAIIKTTRAYRQAAEFIASLNPEALIITTPHTVMYADYFHISPGADASGDFSTFNAPDVKFHVPYDDRLRQCIIEIAHQAQLPAGTQGERDSKLDHGTMVPLYFLKQAFEKTSSQARFLPPIVRIGLSGLPLRSHYLLGQIIKEASETLGRRVAFIASGDLSHKLRADGPYGLAPEGPVYDKRIMDIMSRGAFGDLLEFNEAFCEKAAECGHKSFVIFAGAFDKTTVKSHKLSYESITGVGYGVCLFKADGSDESRNFLEIYDKNKRDAVLKQREKEDDYVALARASLEHYFLHHKKMELPLDLPSQMTEKQAGTFVSLHQYGQLRGCIGTILPTTQSVGEEIIKNALSAALQDPRFEPVTVRDLPTLEYSVDELSPIEEIKSEADLNPARYGVIVRSGEKQGLLLPRLEGVDTVEKQIAIAKQKSGIGPQEPVKLSRFTVTRHE